MKKFNNISEERYYDEPDCKIGTDIVLLKF